MKKHILFAGVAILASTVAIAKTIGFDTPVRWNTLVIQTSLNDVGLFGSYGYHYDVQATYHRILKDLLERDTFSCRTATEVCLTHCNKSDLLRNGRGTSGRKCPDICKEFANALIANNNKNITSRAVDGRGYDCHGRIYSDDKSFYALAQNGNVFDIYESSSNQKIGKTGTLEGEDGTYGAIAIISGGKYNGWKFEVSESISLVSAYDEASCGLGYTTLEQRYGSDVVWHLDDIVSRIERTQDDLRNLMYKTVDNSDGVIESGAIKSRDWFQKVNREIDSIVKEINGIKNASVTPDSYAHGVEYVKPSWMGGTRLDQIRTKLDGYSSDMLEMSRAIDNADCVRRLFRNTDKFKYERTETKEEAYDKVRRSCGDVGLNQMSCSGACKKLGDDKVTCSIGSLSATFVFDSICRTLKDKLDDLGF